MILSIELPKAESYHVLRVAPCYQDKHSMSTNHKWKYRWLERCNDTGHCECAPLAWIIINKVQYYVNNAGVKHVDRISMFFFIGRILVSLLVLISPFGRTQLTSVLYDFRINNSKNRANYSILPVAFFIISIYFWLFMCVCWVVFSHSHRLFVSRSFSISLNPWRISCSSMLV